MWVPEWGEALMEPLLRTREVAVLLGVSKRTVDRLVASGDLPSVKLGDHPTSPRRVEPAAVRAFINRKSVEGD